MEDNLHKIWGERRRILLTDTCEIDLLYLKKGHFCSTHKHKNKINKFIVIKGKVKIETAYGSKILLKNQSFTVEPPLVHRFINLTDGVMVELAYVTKGKIDANDICRFSQGGKFINKKEFTLDDLKKDKLL